MEYKEMAKVMTDEEVKTCMAILIEDSVILDIERNTIQNYIRVKYRLIGDHSKGIYWISLLFVPSHLRWLTHNLKRQPSTSISATQGGRRIREKHH